MPLCWRVRYEVGRCSILFDITAKPHIPSGTSPNIPFPQSSLSLELYALQQMSQLPPYSVDPPSDSSTPTFPLANNRVAGDVQTCSIADLQHDYIRVSRESSTTYHISLTVNPTPIYRIELSTNPSDVGDVLVFPAFSSASLPVAAIRLAKNPKKGEPLATICTLMPHAVNARWRPLVKASSLAYGEDYRSSMPIVIIPGLKPSVRSFTWRTTMSAPYMEVWWEGPLPYMSPRQSNPVERDFRYIFASCMLKGLGGSNENIIQIRRGGGLEFELAVILEMFAILHHTNKLLM
jgi:hypothetical protein